MSRPWILLLPASLCLSALVACGDKADEDTDDGDDGGGGLNSGIDLDGDGYTEDVDCNDNLPYINPGATEVCNSVDDNCNGEIDEGVTTIFYGDDDEDGYGDPNDAVELCNQQPGQVTQGDDCRDDDAAVNPDATEVCDGIDNNCDGETDEDLIVSMYDDSDGDGYGITSSETRGCVTPGKALAGGDCDDDDITRYPGAPEFCGDGIVNDCDGNTTTAAADCTGDLTGNAILLGLGTAFTGDTSDSFGGYSVSLAGDVDGDGDEEILVGSPGDVGFAGAAYLISAGSAAGRTTARAMAAFQGEVEGDLVGYRSAGAGDVDNDGYADILLSGIQGAGIGYVVRGPVTGAMNLRSADVRVLGETADAALGFGLAAAGDLNGDGMDDVLFGAYTDETLATAGGATYVLYGPISDGSDDIDAVADVAIYGSTDNIGSGLGIAGLDLNGDGVGDLAISAPYAAAPVGSGSEGVLHLLYGPLSSGEAVLEDRSDAALYGDGYQDFVGTSVSKGDFNGDGLSDLLVMAINAADYAGRGTVLYGSSTELSGELSLEGVASNKVTSLGEPYYVESYTGAPAGDIDGDGREDLIMGTPYLSYGATTSGSAYVFHGPVSGNLTPADAALQIRSTTANVQAGISVSAAGDFDRDGMPDVLVGAPGSSGGGAGVVISFIGTGDY